MLGIKRHLLVDTLGLVLVTCVSPANAGDGESVMVVLLYQAAGRFPRSEHLRADLGYCGSRFTL
ncbi:hypothetical protein [Sphaerisporangium dianthi]|uniref:Transposase IS4-like domain-containing protein n=1 Tax=Sphaerisporangium dianthi TaxID=1436120 RepID=A0ABV9CBM2_9ACTN